jgi:hypothetical protein
VQTLTVTGAAGTTGTSTASTVTTPLFLAADVNNIVVGKATNEIWGVEVNGRSRLAYFGPATFDILVGARFIEIKQESADLQNIVLSPTAGAGQGTFAFLPGGGAVAVPGPGSTGAGNPNLFPSTATLLGTFTAAINDDIKVRNDYYLAQLGGSFDWQICKYFTLFGFGKLGIGGVRERASLIGTQTTSFTPGSNIIPAGTVITNPAPPPATVLAQPVPAFPTNINGGLIVAPADNGQVRHTDRVAFVPEANLSLAFDPCCWVRLFAGYDVIYFSTVAKVGNVTTTAVTTTGVTFGQQTVTTTTVNPGFRFGGQHSTLQGLNLGVEFRY